MKYQHILSLWHVAVNNLGSVKEVGWYHTYSSNDQLVVRIKQTLHYMFKSSISAKLVEYNGEMYLQHDFFEGNTIIANVKMWILDFLQVTKG